MTKRVVIQSNGGNPLRVGVFGYDADNVSAEKLIFNGNASPLRIYSTNYFVAEPIPNDWNAIARITDPQPVFASPSGQFPLFCVVGFPSNFGSTTRPIGARQRCAYAESSPAYVGFGGVLTPTGIHAFNMARLRSLEGGPVSYTPALVNYLVFKNHG